MKKLLLIAVLATVSYFVQAQTKGTNAVGLGLSFQTQKTEQNSQGNQYINEQQGKGMSLGYGHFVNENVKVGIDFFYGTNGYNSTGGNEFDSKNYGGNLNYQKYYPLLKKFYAFGGGRIAYNHSNGANTSNSQNNDTGVTSNAYSVGVNGGLSWFFAKRLALEADLLSANIGYNRSRQTGTNVNGTYKDTSTGFNLSTTGAVSGLGFKIFFLF